MWDNSFWAAGAGSWGNVTIGTGPAPYYGTYYPGPVYGGYPYGGGATVMAGGDQWIILLGAVVVILLLLK